MHTVLTADALDQMSQDDRWLGFGYLGERRHYPSGVAEQYPDHAALTQEARRLVAETDARVIAAANAAGMDYEDLFRWANNKVGRWFADAAFGGSNAEGSEHYLPGRCPLR